MRTAYDFSPLYRSMIGVDRMADLIETAMRSDGDHGYPPYDVEKTGEDAYRITLAAAGFRREELVGQPHNLVRHPDMPAVVFADLWSTLKSGKSWQGFVKNRCKNGDFYWVDANVSPLKEGGAVVGYVSIRSKASRGQVRDAERLYARLNQGMPLAEATRAAQPWLPFPGMAFASRLGLGLGLLTGYFLLLSWRRSTRPGWCRPPSWIWARCWAWRAERAWRPC